MLTVKLSTLLIAALAVLGWAAACPAAGNVTVAITGFPATLEIVGDQANNALAISGDADGNIWVIGLEDTSPGASHQGTITTINGGLAPVVVPPGTVLFLTVTMGDGDDMVAMDHVSLPLGTNLRTGNGYDVVDIDYAGDVDVQSDEVVARHVSGALIVGAGGGTSEPGRVLIEHLTGSLQLVTGAAHDEIVLRDIDTTYDIVADTGAGHDHVILENATISNVRTEFWMGAGNDWFELLGHSTCGSIAVLFEEGNDLLDARLGTLDIVPQSLLHGGGGHDAVLGAGNLFVDLTDTLIAFERVLD